MTALPVLRDDMSEEEFDRILEKATAASAFLKAISHEGRLMILCHLVSGEKSVTELEDLLSARQAAVSQQLSRLRLWSCRAARARRSTTASPTTSRARCSNASTSSSATTTDTTHTGRAGTAPDCLGRGRAPA